MLDQQHPANGHYFGDTVNPLFNGTHYNSKVLYNVILICTKWLNCSNVYSLLQQIQFNVKMFGNRWRPCKEDPLYI